MKKVITTTTTGSRASRATRSPRAGTVAGVFTSHRRRRRDSCPSEIVLPRRSQVPAGRRGLDQANRCQRKCVLFQPRYFGKCLVPALHDLYEIGSQEGLFFLRRCGRRRVILLQRVLREGADLGVPRSCGAFTPSMRLVSIRRGRGWSLFC